MNFSNSFSRCLAALLTLLLSFVARPEWADPANEPSLDSVVAEGSVYTLAETNGVLYMGGLFTEVGRRTGGWVPVSASTGIAQTQYPQVNGGIYKMVPDGQGGWFMGGKFTVVDGLLHSNLVHIRKNRTVDPFWNSGVNSYIRTMALTNGILYVCGAFTNASGQPRRYAAAFDAVSGALTSWNPNPDGIVDSLVVYGTNVYLAGEFLNVNSTARRRLAAVDLSAGALRSWNPGTLGSSDYAYCMLVYGDRLFVGGRFTTLGGQTRNNIGSFDLTTGTVEAWNPNSGAEVLCLAMGPTNLFIGGLFATIGSSNRMLVAEVDMTNGLATSWDPQISSQLIYQVNSLLVHSNQLFVGGIFWQTGSSYRPFAASFNLGSSQPTSWNPRPNFLVASLTGESNTVYLGGAFSAVGCVGRTNLAAYDLKTKQVLPWNPVTDNTVYAITFNSNTVYFGGEFTNVNNIFRRVVAAVDINTGQLTSWAPNPEFGYVYSLATWSNRLYVGGSEIFASIFRTNLVEFDLATGTMTSWDPQVRSLVKMLRVSGNTLYAGGLISLAGGVSRRGLVAFDLPGGTLNSWNPNFQSASVNDFAIYSNRIYAIGIIRNANGNLRTNFVALDMNTANVLPIIANADSTIYSVAATSNRVFITGQFAAINGQSRNYFAALDTDSGALLPWNPDPGGYYGMTERIFDNVLYVGGPFSTVSSVTTRGLATFPLTAAGTSTIFPETLQRLFDGTLTFQFNAPAANQVTVQSSTNLINWNDRQTISLIGGAGSFTETNTVTKSKQFYRLNAP